MENAPETHILDTPCVICGGAIAITFKRKRHILLPGWKVSIGCENHCDMRRISDFLQYDPNLLVGWVEWAGLSKRRKKAVLEHDRELYEYVVNDINSARRKCEFCRKPPRLEAISSGYRFMCGCAFLKPSHTRDSIHGAVSARESRLESYARLQSKKRTAERFNRTTGSAV